MKKQLHIGILGGSFNPIHIGHLILADYITQFTDVDQVWFMLSPLNPLKQNPEELIADDIRLEMLNIATTDTPRYKACDIELSMPRPSYTINSLQHLSEIYPDYKFSLIIGADNWAIFPQWREHEKIINCFTPIIYPRPGYSVDIATLPDGVRLINAPMLEISSTFLRQAIASGKDMTNFMPNGVARYIKEQKLYQQ